MSHALKVIRKDNYLHVTVTGDNTPDDVLGYLGEVRNACIEHSCPSVLIEENLRGPSMETLELFLIVAKAAQPSPSVRRIAYVDVNPEHDLDRMKFAETVAVNRGMQVRVFASIPDAEQWLTHKATDAESKAC